jgi:arylsulfatase A-like enzyme
VDQAKKYIEKQANQARHKPFFLYFASQDIHVPRAPHPRFQGKTKLGKRGDAMVQFDWSTGEILDALEKHGLKENTIVILSSDNGPVYNDGYEDGSQVERSYAEVDQGHDGSGPFSGGKYQIYEGGTRVPFIIRWPQRIEAGQISSALVNQIDLMASLASLLKVELKKDQAPDSRNNLKSFLGDDRDGLAWMPTEAFGVIGLRKGPWKYVEYPENHWVHKNLKKTELRELFNIDVDIVEKNNLIAHYPEKALEMEQLLKNIKASQGLRN